MAKYFEPELVDWLFDLYYRYFGANWPIVRLANTVCNPGGKLEVHAFFILHRNI